MRGRSIFANSELPATCYITVDTNAVTRSVDITVTQPARANEGAEPLSPCEDPLSPPCGEPVFVDDWPAVVEEAPALASPVPVGARPVAAPAGNPAI